MTLFNTGVDSRGINGLGQRDETSPPDPNDARFPFLAFDEKAVLASFGSLVAAFENATGTLQAVPNVPALTALDDTKIGDGSFCYVQSRKRYFQLDKTVSTALVDGEVVATKSGNGRWVSLDATSSFTWSQVTAWQIDATNGSDDNDGTVAPLKSGEELQRRLTTLGRTAGGGNPVTVALLNGPITLRLVGVKGSFTVTGVATQVFAGTLTNAVAINRNAGTPQTIQAAGMAGSWTAQGAVFNRIRLTSGATLGTAFIMVDDGGGNHQAETTPFVDANGAQFSPAGNENFVVETFATTTISDVFTGGGVGVIETVVALKDVVISQISGANGGQVRPQNSKLVGFVNVFSGAFASTGCFHAGSVGAFNGALASVTSCGMNAPVRTGFGFGISAIATIIVNGDTFMLDATIYVTSPETNRIGPVFWKNTTPANVLIDMSTGASAQTEGGAFQCTGVLYGSAAGANTNGVILGKGARVDLNGNVNTFTSTGNNWQFGSAGKAHGGLPFVDQFNIGAGPVANANMAQVL